MRALLRSFFLVLTLVVSMPSFATGQYHGSGRHGCHDSYSMPRPGSDVKKGNKRSKKAEKYRREAEKWQRKADSYRREAEYSLRMAESYRREAQYCNRRGDYGRARQFARNADRAMSDYNKKMRRADDAERRASEYYRKASFELNYDRRR